MKKQKKLLVVVLVFAIVAAFSVSTVSADWMSPAVIDNVQAAATGDYKVRATKGTWSKTFTISATDANAKSLLAVALTAISADMTIKIEFSGNTITNLILVN